MTMATDSSSTDTSSAGTQKRALLKGGILSAGVLLVLALLVMFNYLSFRHFKRFDWTGSKIYTLSEKSLGVLKGLDKNIELVMVLSPNSQLGSQVYTSTNELVDRYVAANPQYIKRRNLDPARNPLEFERLVKSFGLEREGVIVAARADGSGNLLDKRVIEEIDLAEIDYSGAQFRPAAGDQGIQGRKADHQRHPGAGRGQKTQDPLHLGHGEASLEPQGDGYLAVAGARTARQGQFRHQHLGRPRPRRRAGRHRPGGGGRAAHQPDPARARRARPFPGPGRAAALPGRPGGVERPDPAGRPGAARLLRQIRRSR